MCSGYLGTQQCAYHSVNPQYLLHYYFTSYKASFSCQAGLSYKFIASIFFLSIVIPTKNFINLSSGEKIFYCYMPPSQLPEN